MPNVLGQIKKQKADSMLGNRMQKVHDVLGDVPPKAHNTFGHGTVWRRI